ncbi:TPA: hypothetical protein DIV55_00315 [Patescibacteria group bacterium]|uniref:C2H2-type domain-containing protein n=1 Tax=Candidatus Gottesmanbacteria bacterium GW2011_GWA1_43_11 TaxID=1618436 RepID=A0A0G1EL52_9BACT|nr:MAG: hypothetical protein UV59_C0032G0014 [Candidatus Gottesmanbacteria bacterium GW2011_GWA1_43_11]HCS78170.1 hypothetical protein [Patescibacteria group bacterium]
MVTKVHVCDGTCGAEISDEQFQAGLTKCGADGCTMQGQPFSEKFKCSECGNVYANDVTHEH